MFKSSKIGGQRILKSTYWVLFFKKKNVHFNKQKKTLFSIAKVGKIAGRAPQQRMRLTPAIGKAGTGVRQGRLTWVMSHQEVRA